jgi:hypothetical protein
MLSSTTDLQAMRQTLKRAAGALRDAEVPFCVIGSLSAWMRGAAEPDHDIDFGIRAMDILAAAAALEAVGMQIEVPSAEWIIKAWDGIAEGDEPVAVDLIYAPVGVPITDEVLARCDQMQVLKRTMLVLHPDDLMVMKLLSVREPSLDFTSVMMIARAIREQVCWATVRERTAGSPYAQGFFAMAQALGIISEHDAALATKPLVSWQRDLRQLGDSAEFRRQLLARGVPGI